MLLERRTIPTVVITKRFRIDDLDPRDHGRIRALGISIAMPCCRRSVVVTSRVTSTQPPFSALGRYNLKNNQDMPQEKSKPSHIFISFSFSLFFSRQKMEEEGGFGFKTRRAFVGDFRWTEKGVVQDAGSRISPAAVSQTAWRMGLGCFWKASRAVLVWDDRGRDWRIIRDFTVRPGGACMSLKRWCYNTVPL